MGFFILITKTMKRKKHSHLILVTEETHTKLRLYCAEEGFYMSHVADEAIKKYLKRYS